ncbi:uncharacterized protein MELLADRAFT_73509 [Melampsora larici-populina 98AG31]|uniref:Uncharacterized protein n=1 Tax=Melampsora larici-populina (strain 98AG31 / pathotype 3-4-7) TaxID=747676 RepID=F4S957_MELLP|nr:uncharacterized protein MELLADRAFT_73509 [Melampsora larici-populina 98AG31]EGF98822.1 hypothetical protein MELLADRAFT_73509 [Melampsora larici-populina 98AG31]
MSTSINPISTPITTTTTTTTMTNSTNKSMNHKWPNGVKKPMKELDYHSLIGVKEVKSELENTLGDLSEWLESCEIGLGLLIDAMK